MRLFLKSRHACRACPGVISCGRIRSVTAVTLAKSLRKHIAAQERPVSAPSHSARKATPRELGRQPAVQSTTRRGRLLAEGAACGACEETSRCCRTRASGSRRIRGQAATSLQRCGPRHKWRNDLVELGRTGWRATWCSITSGWSTRATGLPAPCFARLGRRTLEDLTTIGSSPDQALIELPVCQEVVVSADGRRDSPACGCV